MAMEEEPMVGTPEEEEGAESSNRMFMILALGLGGLFVIGLICIGAVFFMQQGQANQQKAANATIIAKNTAAVLAATASAMPTETIPPTETPVPPTPVLPTNTPVVSTPTVPAPTETAMSTAVASSKATATATTASATQVAAVASPGSSGGVAATAPAPTSTAATGETPATGVGGFGMVLVAAMLLAVLFAARRLRLAQR